MARTRFTKGNLRDTGDGNASVTSNENVLLSGNNPDDETLHSHGGNTVHSSENALGPSQRSTKLPGSSEQHSTGSAHNPLNPAIQPTVSVAQDVPDNDYNCEVTNVELASEGPGSFLANRFDLAQHFQSPDCKLTCISAGVESGKTTAVFNCISKSDKVLVISYRQLLANSLSKFQHQHTFESDAMRNEERLQQQTIELNHYKDLLYFLHTQPDKEPRAPVSRQDMQSAPSLMKKRKSSSFAQREQFKIVVKDYCARLVICLNSLKLLCRNGDPVISSYDYVVIDEAYSVMDHCVAEKLASPDLTEILSILRDILQHAKRIVIMQHGLPSNTISWFQAIGKISQKQTHLIKVTSPASVMPVDMVEVPQESWNDGVRGALNILRWMYAGCVLKGKGKLYVPCSTPSLAYQAFFAIQDCLCGLVDSRRITPLDRINHGKLVRLAVKNRRHQQHWLEIFNEYPEHVDCTFEVIISTPVIQSGLSLPPGVKYMVGLITNYPVTFHDSFQQISRLRTKDRSIGNHRGLLLVQTGKANGNDDRVGDSGDIPGTNDRIERIQSWMKHDVIRLRRNSRARNSHELRSQYVTPGSCRTKAISALLSPRDGIAADYTENLKSSYMDLGLGTDGIDVPVWGVKQHTEIQEVALDAAASGLYGPLQRLVNRLDLDTSDLSFAYTNVLRDLEIPIPSREWISESIQYIQENYLHDTTSDMSPLFCCFSWQQISMNELSYATFVESDTVLLLVLSMLYYRAQDGYPRAAGVKDLCDSRATEDLYAWNGLSEEAQMEVVAYASMCADFIQEMHLVDHASRHKVKFQFETRSVLDLPDKRTNSELLLGAELHEFDCLDQKVGRRAFFRWFLTEGSPNLRNTEFRAQRMQRIQRALQYMRVNARNVSSWWREYLEKPEAKVTPRKRLFSTQESQAQTDPSHNYCNGDNDEDVTYSEEDMTNWLDSVQPLLNKLGLSDVTYKDGSCQFSSEQVLMRLGGILARSPNAYTQLAKYLDPAVIKTVAGAAALIPMASAVKPGPKKLKSTGMDTGYRVFPLAVVSQALPEWLTTCVAREVSCQAGESAEMLVEYLFRRVSKRVNSNPLILASPNVRNLSSLPTMQSMIATTRRPTN